MNFNVLVHLDFSVHIFYCSNIMRIIQKKRDQNMIILIRTPGFGNKLVNANINPFPIYYNTKHAFWQNKVMQMVCQSPDRVKQTKKTLSNCYLSLQRVKISFVSFQRLQRVERSFYHFRVEISLLSLQRVEISFFTSESGKIILSLQKVDKLFYHFKE